MAKRRAIRPVDRFEIFKRDGFVCQYCGQSPPTVVLELDHIIAVVNGGENDALNLITACKQCNQGKAARPLEIVPPPLQATIEERQERAAQIKRFNAFLMAQRTAQIKTIRRINDYWFEKCDKPGFIFDEVGEQKFRIFLEHLTEAEILDAIDIAYARKLPNDLPHADDTWRYFCGVCWNRIRAKKGE